MAIKAGDARVNFMYFFIKYQDRIIFGTDIMKLAEIKTSMNRVWVVRNFLESSKEFYTPKGSEEILFWHKEPFCGLGLPENVLRKIYYGNFQKMWGKKPRKVNLELAIKQSQERKEKIVLKALRNIAG